MFSILSRYTIASMTFLLVIDVVSAQPAKIPLPKGKEDAKDVMAQTLKKAEEEYRIFFKKPEITPEFWAAINFEIAVGKFDVAGLHLGQMLQKEPADKVDADLLVIEEVEGLSAFLKLRAIRKWYDQPELQAQAVKNVELLIQRVSSALEKQLSDGARLNKFINSLVAPTIEERLYGFAQIKRSKERATPYLVEAMRVNTGKPMQQRIAQIMLDLDTDIVPPLFEALRPANPADENETDLRYMLLDVIHKRADTRVVPYLWHLSSSSKNAPLVRAKAKEMLSQFLGVEPENLPDAKIALTQLAEKYYQHQVRFTEPKRVRVWPWNGTKIEPAPIVLTAAQAEELYGLRYAKQAIDLDPGYRPAQVVYLSMLLERSLRDNLDKLLGQPLPADVRELLATVDVDLLLAVLERGLNDRNSAVILPVVLSLAERGEHRAARATTSGASGALVRALYYPDRRVQMAAARALLRMPPSPTPVASTRVVEILKRNAAAEPMARALVIGASMEQAADIRKAVKGAGFEPVLAQNFKEAFALIRQSAAFDVILLVPSMLDVDLPFVITQLRADPDVGLLPLLVVGSPARQASLGRLLQQHANSAVLPDVALGMPEELQNRLELAIKQAGQPISVQKAPIEQKPWIEEDLAKAKAIKLTDPERKGMPREALDSLWRMSRGEITGYDLRPAKDAILAALNSDDTALQALETLAALPGPDTQQRLAAIVLDAKRGKLRIPAAYELNRHVQKSGLNLLPDQVAQLKALYNTTMDDPGLRSQLATLIGSMPATAAQTGERLLRPLPPPPPSPPEKEK